MHTATRDELISRIDNFIDIKRHDSVSRQVYARQIEPFIYLHETALRDSSTIESQ